jgi:hypothetical protein
MSRADPAFAQRPSKWNTAQSTRWSKHRLQQSTRGVDCREPSERLRRRTVRSAKKRFRSTLHGLCKPARGNQAAWRKATYTWFRAITAGASRLLRTDARGLFTGRRQRRGRRRERSRVGTSANSLFTAATVAFANCRTCCVGPSRLRGLAVTREPEPKALSTQAARCSSGRSSGPGLERYSFLGCARADREELSSRTQPSAKPPPWIGRNGPSIPARAKF